MAFCEDCGAELSSGVAFCENCGAKLAIPETVSLPKNLETGIVYTNLTLLEKHLPYQAGEIRDTINGFISAAQTRGVCYTLVDASSSVSGIGSVAAHVNVLKNIVAEKHPKYLFIIGSENVVPSIVWENEAEDQLYDSDVSSDLPYATLDTNSPFDGQEYDFSETLRVGRLPNVDIKNYFHNLEASCGKIQKMQTFGLSAKVWKKETVDIYSRIQEGPAVFTSPNYVLDNVSEIIPTNTNLCLFNLHGDAQTPYWYGEEEGVSAPEAIEPQTLDCIETPYFLAVEACYGAIYADRSIDQSVLLSALSGTCVAFLGSSRIAFGTPMPPGCCADIICGKYLENLKSGMTTGDALEAARSVLMEDDDAETIKTLAEFSLYGDPSARMHNSQPAAKGSFGTGKNGSFSKGIRIPMPNIRRAVRLELARVEDKIARAVSEAVYQRYGYLQDTEPKFYRNVNKHDEYSAVFVKELPSGAKIVSASFTKNGDIKRIIESK